MKLDHAVQDSHFTIQAYERLVALHHDNNDHFLWTKEKRRRFDWGTADCNSEGGMEASGDTSGTSLPSSYTSGSGEDDDDSDGNNNDDEGSESGDSVQILEVVDDSAFIDLTEL